MPIHCKGDGFLLYRHAYSFHKGGKVTKDAKTYASHFRKSAFSMLCEATERAMLLSNSNEICICGGVAQNSRLKKMLTSIAEEHSARMGFTENQYNADNGAMIAFVAERMLEGRLLSQT